MAAACSGILQYGWAARDTHTLMRQNACVEVHRAAVQMGPLGRSLFLLQAVGLLKSKRWPDFHSNLRTNPTEAFVRPFTLWTICIKQRQLQWNKNKIKRQTC